MKIISSYNNLAICANREPASRMHSFFKQTLAGTSGKIFNALITARLPELALSALKKKDFLQPFHGITSGEKCGFKEYLNLLKILSAEDMFIRAWLYSFGREGQITQEVSLSRKGVSLNGELFLQNSPQAGIDFISREAPPVLKSQSYRIGGNCGAMMLGDSFAYTQWGIEAVKVSDGLFSSLPEREEHYYLFTGASDAQNFLTVISGMLPSTRLLRFEFLYPSLSAAVRKAYFYYNYSGRKISFNLELFACSEKIQRNLLASLFKKSGSNLQT